MELNQPAATYGSPQKEDGYTPIANELLEAILLADFSKRQILIIMTIARMTYGYSKKSDALSGWQIASMTGIDRSDVSKTINELVKMNVITKHENGRESHGIFVNEISLNKYYKTWQTVGELPTVGKTPTVGKLPTVTVGKLPTEPLVKHPTHKAIKTNKTNMSEFDEFWTNYPNKSAKKKAIESWVKNKPELEKVLKALAWQKAMWAKDQNKFVPMPATYINQARWEDEPIASKVDESIQKIRMEFI